MGRRTASDGIENRLRDFRLGRGLSQSQLAGRAGITRQAVNGIESSHYVPNTAVAIKLAAALNCRVEDIFHLAESLPELQAVTSGERWRPGDRLAMARVG